MRFFGQVYGYGVHRYRASFSEHSILSNNGISDSFIEPYGGGILAGNFCINSLNSFCDEPVMRNR